MRMKEERRGVSAVREPEIRRGAVQLKVANNKKKKFRTKRRGSRRGRFVVARTESRPGVAGFSAAAVILQIGT